MAAKTMKKAEIIKSKHVDHIENEKNILEKLEHPFVVMTFQIKYHLAGILRFPSRREIHILLDRAVARG